MQGHIVKYFKDRKIGWIQPNGSNDRLYFRGFTASADATACLCLFVEGAPVEFDSMPDNRDPSKLQAVNIRLLFGEMKDANAREWVQVISFDGFKGWARRQRRRSFGRQSLELGTEAAAF